MLKFFGAVLLMGGASVIGFSAAAGLRAHVNCLRVLAIALEQMERELKFRLTPLPALFHKLARSSGAPVDYFFALCEKGFNRLDDQPLNIIWREALEKSKLPLEQDEEFTLTELGSVLGQYDTDGQRAALFEARERLAFFLKRAEDERCRLEKVYGALGLSAGAFLLLVLL
jgi:stage III sporulation protein AB